MKLLPSTERFIELIRLWRTLRHGKRSTLIHMFSGGDEWNIAARGDRVVLNVSAGAGTLDVTLIMLTADDAESVVNRLNREIAVVRARQAPVERSEGRRKNSETLNVSSA